MSEREGTAAPVHGVNTLANAHKLTLVSATRLSGLEVSSTRLLDLLEFGTV